MKTFRRLRYAPRGAQISQNSHCISPWPKSRKKIREITFGPGQSHLHCSLFLSTSLHHGRQPNERERISACAQHIILRGALRPWSPSWRSCPTDDVSSTVHTQHRRHMRQRLAPRTLPNAASPDLRDPRFTKPCWRCPRREVDASIPVHMQCNGARPRCLYPKLTSSIPCALSQASKPSSFIGTCISAAAGTSSLAMQTAYTSVPQAADDYTSVAQAADDDGTKGKLGDIAASVERAQKARAQTMMLFVILMCFGCCSLPRSLLAQHHTWREIGGTAMDAIILAVVLGVLVGFRYLRPDAFCTVWLCASLGSQVLFIACATLLMTTDAVVALEREKRTNAGNTVVLFTALGMMLSTLPRSTQWKAGMCAGSGAIVLVSDGILWYVHSMDVASLVLSDLQQVLLPYAAGILVTQLVIRGMGKVLTARMEWLRVQLAESERRVGELESARREALVSRFIPSHHDSNFDDQCFMESASTCSEVDGAGRAGEIGGASARDAQTTLHDPLSIEPVLIDWTIPLGKGGMCDVHLGTWLGTSVAVKVVRDYGRQPSHALLAEARMLSLLRHPCICSLYSALELDDGRPAIVLEYMSRGTLFDMLHRPGQAITASTAVLCSIMRETASGLAYLHANGYMHRDVKSTNVLLDDKFHAKVADFSIAKYRTSSSDLLAHEFDPASVHWDSDSRAKHTFLVGTPRYMAPVRPRHALLNAQGPCAARCVRGIPSAFEP